MLCFILFVVVVGGGAVGINGPYDAVVAKPLKEHRPTGQDAQAEWPQAVTGDR